jgi:hypothetical protein
MLTWILFFFIDLFLVYLVILQPALALWLFMGIFAISSILISLAMDWFKKKK